MRMSNDAIFTVGCMVLISPMLFMFALWPGVYEREMAFKTECMRLGGTVKSGRDGNICLRPGAVIDVNPQVVP